MPIGSILTQFANRARSKTPLLNEILIPSFNVAGLRSNTTFSKKKNLIANYKSIPELTALINKVANAANERYYFEPLEKKQSNRNRVLQADKFATNINLTSLNQSSFIDILSTGEAFDWIGKLSKEQVDETVKEAVIRKGMPFNLLTKEFYMKANFGEAYTDEDILKPRKLRYVASSTVDTIHDGLDVVEYKQVVGTSEVNYTPKEIIHFKFLEVDGKVNGFTPVVSILVQLELLHLMWQNQLALVRNGGKMDMIISIEDLDVSNPSFKRIEQEIRKYGVVQNRHGVLLLGGKVKTEEIKQLDNMQFESMGLYITGLIAMQWGIQRASLGLVNKDANTKDDSGGSSDRDFYRNLERFQDSYLHVFNTQFWIPYFSVKMCFDKAYKHDELLEVQTEQTRLNNMTFMNNLLAKSKKQLNPQYIMREMDIDEDDLEEFQMDPMQEMQQQESTFRQDLAKNKTMLSGEGQNNKNEKKKAEADNSKDKKGNSGYGKEVDRERLTYLNFVSKYKESGEEDKVIYSQKDGLTRFCFKSYETVIPTTELMGINFMTFKELEKVDEKDILGENK